jgi:cell wall-associated NlpC family hydrolase
LPAAATPGQPDYPSARQVERGLAEVRAAAAQVSRVQARLAEMQEQVERAGARAAAAFEAYNGAVYRLDRAREAAREARQAHARAEAAAAEARLDVGRVAVSYREGNDLASFAVVLDADSPRQMLDRAVFRSYLGRHVESVYERSERTRAEAERARHNADAAVAAQRAATEEVRVARDRAQAQLQTQRSQRQEAIEERDRLLAGLAQIRGSADLLVQRRLAGLAAAQRLAEQRASTHSGPTSAAAERALDYAYAQLGKPYEWAADGPDTFDCSGLTMRAWQRGGVQLPHYSVAQYGQSAPLDLADLRRGDLVFFAADLSDHRTIYHVGMYVGGGQMIEAPYTGETVRVSSIWRASLFGAARP